MANANQKAWERGNRDLDRHGPSRERRRVLILCEDEKSSRLYLKAFPYDPRRVEVRTEGTGHNTDSLVELAMRLKRDADRAGRPYNRVYCVFDRDSFPAQNFNRAFQLARNNAIYPIWVNEAFELWYLLHFDYINTGIGRAQYKGMLDQPNRLNGSYQKNDDTIYARLKEHQPKAFKFARKLAKHWIDQGGCNPEVCNPSTNVDDLVAFLNQLAELGVTDDPA